MMADTIQVEAAAVGLPARDRLLPALPRDAWVVLAGDALSAVGSGLTLPFFVIYLHSVRGVGLAAAGMAAATVAFTSFFGNPLGGLLADRVGARDTVIAGLVVAAAGAVSVTVIRQPWHAFGAAAMVGLGASVVWPAQDTLLGRLVPADRRAHVFSVRHATLNAGLGAGALVAAAIVDVSAPGTFVALYLLDACSFLAFVPLLLTLPRRVDEPGPATAPAGAGGYRAVLADPVFARVLVLSALLVTVGYGQYHVAFPAFATGRGGISAQALGLAFAANTLTVVAAQLVTMRLLAGRRRTFALRLTCAGWAAAWACTLLGGRLGGGPAAEVAFVAAMVVFGLGETAFAPTLPAIVNDLAPDGLRGRYNGLSTLAWTTGFFVGPAAAGVALDAGHGSALFAGLIGACGVAAVGAGRLERRLPAAANLIGS
jgi:MFS family permease